MNIEKIIIWGILENDLEQPRIQFGKMKYNNPEKTVKAFISIDGQEIGFLKAGEASGSVAQASAVYDGPSIIFNDGSKGAQNGDVIPGAIASGFQSLALGGLRYDYYNPSANNYGRTPTSAEGPQAFAAGGSCHAYGGWSMAIGKDTKAYMRASAAFGGGTQAGMSKAEFEALYPEGVDIYGSDYNSSYSYAIALGEGTKALGRASVASGLGSQAIGRGSLAFGWNNITNGEFSMAVGSSNTTTGNRGVAIGYETEAFTDGFTGGYQSKTTAQGCLAYGDHCTANALYSVAFGRNSNANGQFSIAMGEYVNTTEDGQVVLGVLNKDNPNAVLIVGNGTWSGGRSNGLAVLKDGRGQVYGTPIEENDIVRFKELSDYKNSIGKNCTISGDQGLATGFSTTAFTNCFTGGYQAKATQQGCIAFGDKAEANGLYSYAFGRQAITSNQFSVAFGQYVTTNADNQAVFGILNQENANAIFIVGNGYWQGGKQKANAFEIMKDNRGKVYGTPHENNDIIRWQEYQKLVTAIEALGGSVV